MNKTTKFFQLSSNVVFFYILLNTSFWGYSHPHTFSENEMSFGSSLNINPQVKSNNYSEIAERKNLSFPDNQDSNIWQNIIVRVNKKGLKKDSFSNIVQTVATELLGSKYEAGLLDRTERETLVISLQKFDCLLFVETVLAIARNIASQDYDYQSFTQNIETQRYRQGKMTDYCSRLHYFSDWIYDNEKRNLVTNITADLGGIEIPKKLNFMTSHRRSYPRLVKNETNYQCIAEVERKLEKLTFNYIPSDKVRSIYYRLQPGDIIGIATNIKGLDFTHTGLVYQDEKGNIGLIHASPAGQVVIAKDLQYYVQNVSNAIGIVVARPN